MTDKLGVLQILLAMFPDSQINPMQASANEAGSASEAMAGLASHLIECARNNQTERFPKFFEQVEFHIIYGSEDVRKMLLLGLLEDLKNFASVQNLDYSVFEPWLGPETYIAWRWLEKRWQGSASLADSVRFRKTSEES